MARRNKTAAGSEHDPAFERESSVASAVHEADWTEHARGLGQEPANTVGREEEIDDYAPVGIRFTEEDHFPGADVLLEYGPAQAFPDYVYVASYHKVRKTALRLEKMGINVWINTRLPGRLTIEEARSISQRVGWRLFAETESALNGHPKETQ